MLTLVSALETLQNANLNAGSQVFSWSFHCPGPQPLSSLGVASFPCDSLDDIQNPRELIVVGGPDVSVLNVSKLNVWLNRHARKGVRLSGLTTGAFVLGYADLIRDAEVTLHWQFRDAFRETFSDVDLSPRPYVATGTRCSSSGGVSAIDLFLSFLVDYRGQEFADSVSESMNYVTMQQVQRVASAEASARTRIKNGATVAALEIMESNLEFPVTPPQIAAEVGVSTRQLERLFGKHLGQSPKRHYMHLRLRRAYFLLTQTKMPVIEVAIACGFQSPGHFSKCFRNEFALTPTELLKSHRV